MEQTSNQPTFLDSLTTDLGGHQKNNSFANLPTSNFPVVIVVKCMPLRKWLNHLDPMLEVMLYDRTSFQAICGPEWS